MHMRSEERGAGGGCLAGVGVGSTGNVCAKRGAWGQGGNSTGNNSEGSRQFLSGFQAARTHVPHSLTAGMDRTSFWPRGYNRNILWKLLGAFLGDHGCMPLFCISSVLSSIHSSFHLGTGRWGSH